MPPSEATQSEFLSVVLKDSAQAAQAAKVVLEVEGVTKVDCVKDGTCTVTAKPGTAKAVAEALAKAGIKADVEVKKS